MGTQGTKDQKDQRDLMENLVDQETMGEEETLVLRVDQDVLDQREKRAIVGHLEAMGSLV